MKIKFMMLASCFALGIAASGNVASASTFNYTSYAVTNNQNGSIATPVSEAVGLGQLVLTGTGTGDFSSVTSIAAWCLDMFHTVQGSASYDKVPVSTAPISSGGGTSNPPLSTTGLSSTQIGQIGGLMSYGNANANNNVTVGGIGVSLSSATQVAIWRVEYNASSNVLTLAADATDQAIWTEAGTLIAALGGSIPLNVLWDFLVPNGPGSNGNQVLAFVPGNAQEIGPAPTPLPAALPLFATGLGVMGLLGWRRKRKRTALAA